MPSGRRGLLIELLDREKKKICEGCGDLKDGERILGRTRDGDELILVGGNLGRRTLH